MLSHPMLSLGFRPFFLLAGVMATLWLPLWLVVWRGWLALPTPLGAVGWHRHEMLFGYTLAVVGGFLLTAAGNWTRRPMPRGGLLLGLVLLWAVPRLGVPILGLLPPAGALVVAVLDVAFPLAVAAALWPALWGTRSWRNLGFLPLLALFAAANAAVHLEAAGVLPYRLMAGPVASRFALDVVVLVMVVMGGRVIPFFTANALPEARVRRIPAADRISVALVGLLVLVEPLPLDPAVAGWVALAAALANGWRMTGWGGWATRGRPILWVLHLAYAWIVVGLALRGLSGFLLTVPPSAGIHALTVGGIGALTLGMMARVSLGHTGRPLQVHPAITAAFALIHLSAAARVGLALAGPGLYFTGLLVSGVLWSAAFATFLAIYWPILTRPRADGRPG